ncbi:MAG: hypothetical protein HC831_11725, partial [Chloroflexia bacterium]|nr:hypothetical protein [Chloroflexia bacterium]
MERSDSARIILLFRQHGVKMLLFTILLFVLFKKDISFGIHFRTPNPALKQQEHTHPAKQTKQKEQPYLSEDVVTTKESSTLLERFSNFSLFGNRAKKNVLAQIDAATIDAFLNRFAKIAQVESQKYGPPASLILAHAMLQSQAGTHILAQQGNNYFALPCTD